MINEKVRYQEIASEDSEMFMAANDGIIIGKTNTSASA